MPGLQPEVLLRVKKTFVLDTNVLLHDPKAITAFDDNDVVVPIYVIEEIDTFKRDLSELGRNARQVSRQIDTYRERGSLATGVPIGERGGLLKVLFTERLLPREMGSQDDGDGKILAVALDVRDQHPGVTTIFVTKDTNLRIRADAFGLAAEDFDSERVEISELYKGWSEHLVDGSAIDALHSGKPFPSPLEGVSPNELLHLRDAASPGHTALARYSAKSQRPEPLSRVKDGVWGIRPRNMEQNFALDLLLDDEVKLVTLVGKAGTGKTLLAIAAGLQKAMEEGVYHRLLVSRPIFPLGRDIGYLPGDVEEKLNPWMQPIFDNVEFLMNLSRADKRAGRSYQELMDLGILEIEPLTYIRGRSIPHQFIIVDEAQNLTPHEVKTILTRAGDGTKIVLTGDPYQIDNPYVDATNNGLVHVVNRFRNQPLAGHITLGKGERSALAELATNLL